MRNARQEEEFGGRKTQVAGSYEPKRVGRGR